jgi:hypothetical protein
MTHNRLFHAVMLLAGLTGAQAATAASPIVIVNQGQNNECQITPSSNTVFTLSTEGNVLINGSYTSGTCGSTGGGNGSPTFSFNPNPANLTIANNSLPSSGGTVTPNFVAYFANTCKGSVTPGSGCAAVSGNWGTGGTVCTGTTNANGQTYCSPGSATVTLPANTAQTSCTYTFQATNCTNGTTSVSSATAVVTVAAAGTVGGPCSPTDIGDLPGDWTRQCSGNATNYHGAVAWDNTYATLFGAAWPGAAGQYGHAWTVTVGAATFASFQLSTGTTQAGIHIYPNNSFGQTGTASISTAPGHFLDVPSGCAGSNLFISSKTGTAAACKLLPNTTYYLNIVMASLPDGTPVCGGSSCTTGWAFDQYNG